MLDAIANGTIEGVKLAVNIGAMLLVFLAFVAMFNAILSDLIGANTSLNNWVYNITNGRYEQLNLQFLLGSILSPFMWLLGVPTEDIAYIGQLLGEKIVLNEFISYTTLAHFRETGILNHPKSVLMAIYMLCGFANIGSIGIQIGGIGGLAPSRKVWITELGVKAVLAGTLTSCMSATIIGMLV